MRDEERGTRIVSPVGAVEGGTAVRRQACPRGDGRLTREDLLQVAISVVKSEEHYSRPVDFISDVAVTFEALSEETPLLVGSCHEGSPNRMRRRASRPDPADSLKSGVGWPKAS